MTPVLAPRVMLVTRPTDLELLVAEHGTREQARFLTRDRPGWFEEAVRRDELQRLAVADVLNGIPVDWRRGRLDRSDLATFAFAPEDVVVAVGQDGLVANVAKYLDRQLVIGVNPDPDNVEGTLVRFTRTQFSSVISLVAQNRAPADELTLIEARLDDGQVLRALNEIFIGHRSHQSARYRLRIDEREERQSSSGIIVATGTGATGWARSITRERNLLLDLDARSRRLAVLVREAFPAPGFGTQLTTALVDDGAVSVTSEMGEGGVIFGDGIEPDYLAFGWGRRVELRAANVPLRLAGRSS